jgi:cobalt-precorrin-5B (C1)-methyltransferase
MLLAQRSAATPLNPPLVRGESIAIPFPDGSRVSFKINNSGYREEGAFASIIKDAGDDPDITHGAEIVAEARSAQQGIVLKGGVGVGRVTKPGLAVAVGEPAINPVPRRMILQAVQEAISETGFTSGVEITISVPAGEALAKKTLNSRLGIIGGISILGTTGIVKPISTEAYTASISAGMDVAKATGRNVVVLSSGRTSEKAHEKKYGFPEESYVMMGDYLEFSLQEAKKHAFEQIHLAAQWAKMIKTAMAIPQTHVRHGAIEGNEAAAFLRSKGVAVPDRPYNTAREIFDYIASEASSRDAVFVLVCDAAKQYAETIAAGIPLVVNLVSYEGAILARSK